MKYYLMIFFFLSFTGLVAQLKVEQWSDYLPLKKGELVVKGDDEVFLVSSTGVFFLDQETNSYNIISALNDLGNAGIKSASYCNSIKALVLGFGDGLIVLWSKGVIYKITDLQSKYVNQDKSINNITIDGTNAYLATELGVIKVNLIKREIVETYTIASNNEKLVIIDIAVNNDNIWVVSTKQVYSADMNQTNLIDYRAWSLVLNAVSTENFNSIETFEGKLVIGVSHTDADDSIVEIDGQKITTINLGYNQMKLLRSFNNQLDVIRNESVEILNSNYASIGRITEYTTEDEIITPISPSDLITDDFGKTFIADRKYGLVEYSATLSNYYYPNRPSSQMGTEINIDNSKVLITTGRFSDDLIDPVLTLRSDGYWESAPTSTSGFSNVYNLLSAEFYPGNNANYYASSWGFGLFKFLNNELIFKYDNTNSPLQKYDNYRCWVSGLCFDKDNYLWILNSRSTTPLLAKNEKDEWYTFDYPGLANSSIKGESQFIQYMTIDSRNFKWITIAGNGLFVVDDNKTKTDASDDLYRGLKSKFDDRDPRNAGILEIIDEDGNHWNKSVNALAEDKDGYMWFGSDQGLYVMYRAWAVFDDEIPSFNKIKVPRNDGTNDADYLLDNIKITAIKVDGANRKWIGTESSGLFLVSEDGTKTIHEFNTENSPLLSNTITSIGIDEKTGEVYIGTGMGIVSFKGTAIEGLQAFSNVYAYPNPVTSGYQGKITIKGLMGESNVKITDISGNIVYETLSLGGSAIWDGRNAWGEKVCTGVYLVFVSSPDGMESEVTKILIIKGE